MTDSQLMTLKWYCPLSFNWNTQRPNLREGLAHLVDNIKWRVCGIASAGSPLFSVWSFLVVLKSIARARSKYLRAWGCWCSRGISDDCNDRRMPRSALQGLLGRSSYPAGCGSSMFDATVRSCPEFADDMVLPWHAPFSYRPAIQPTHQRRS